MLMRSRRKCMKMNDSLSKSNDTSSYPRRIASVIYVGLGVTTKRLGIL